MDREYLSIEQVATHFGVSKLTILNWIKKKKIPGFQIERTARIPRDAFLSYLEKITKEPEVE